MKREKKIELDKKRTLKMCTRTFPTVENVLDITMDKMDFEKQETIFALLLGLLIHEDRTLTLDDVYDILDQTIEKRMEKENIVYMEAFGAVLQEVSEAVGELMNEEKPKE